MILPGTKYKVVKDNFLLSIGTEFYVSIWSDPRLSRTCITGPEIANEIEISSEEVEENAVLVSDFNEAIYFYVATDDYGCFSNFSAHGITKDAVYYPTVEHYYQARKFIDAQYQERIRRTESPKKASLLGKLTNYKMVDNWDQLKIDVMLEAVTLKFTQHVELKEVLIATENNLLVENSPYDNFWGIGREGIGYNFLGTVLMRVRESLSKRN